MREGQPRRVLVVDDDQSIRDTIALVLREEGLVVVTAGHGGEALEWLRAHPLEAGLVLLDLMMPVMDGAAFLEARAADAAVAQVPVVVITAGGDCPRIRRRFDVHACLSKPVSLERLCRTVNDCLGHRDGG
jgi:two-component system, chemotaxis family, chemotaxis protein CheY